MKVNKVELVVAALILALTTAIATGYINLPFAALSSVVPIVILVIASIGAFSVAPAVGISLFLLTAVLLFKRNVDKTLSSANSTYGAISIPAQALVGAAVPHTTVHSGPRQYDQFQETDGNNPLHIETFEPAPYGDEQGSPVDGQYPKEEARATTSAESVDYTYRPDADTGDNTFTRIGPNIDEKATLLKY